MALNGLIFEDIRLPIISDSTFMLKCFSTADMDSIFRTICFLLPKYEKCQPQLIGLEENLIFLISFGGVFLAVFIEQAIVPLQSPSPS